MNLPLLALASAVGHGALIPDHVAQRGRDVSEALLSGAGDVSAIGDIIETDILNGLDNAADPLLDFLGGGDDGEEPMQTIFQLMSECPQTSKWTALIKEHDDLVQLLNSTEASHTLFVPTDEAFERLPFKDRPSDEYIRAALEYHIATGVHTAHDLVKTETVETVLKEDWLGGNHQRLRAGFGLKGLNLNFISKVVKSNIVSIPLPRPINPTPAPPHANTVYRRQPTASSMPSTTPPSSPRWSAASSPSSPTSSRPSSSPTTAPTL